MRISPLRIIRNGHGELPPRRVILYSHMKLHWDDMLLSLRDFMAVLVGGLLLSVTEAKQSILSGYIIIFVHPNGTHL